MTWSLRYESRCFTANSVRRMNHFAYARLVAEWRDAFGWLAKGQRIPKLERIAVTVQSEWKPPVADPCAEVLAVKAAIDGLRDAGVIADDTGEHVASVLFLAPRKASTNAMTLTIREADSE